MDRIALVVSALGVGIGFGLQNVTGNFVSGLILLFERPVRPGDWVVVGATEGYVVKINIRSTLIQTFDRADVLVPNSELLSTHVKNWTLQDPYSRVIVPVGVAYGTDVNLVRETLLEIAMAHSMVLTNTPKAPQPNVMFMGFGASSLDFELRCFIHRADYMLAVRSDILFAIDDAFREGFAELGKRALSFDAWLYHHQIPELTDLARAFPDVTIIFDHFGGPLGIGPYEGKGDEIFVFGNEIRFAANLHDNSLFATFRNHS